MLTLKTKPCKPSTCAFAQICERLIKSASTLFDVCHLRVTVEKLGLIRVLKLTLVLPVFAALIRLRRQRKTFGSTLMKKINQADCRPLCLQYVEWEVALSGVVGKVLVYHACHG